MEVKDLIHLLGPNIILKINVVHALPLTLDITNIEFQVIHKILKLFDMEKMLE
jgi:hypothetical protein